MPHYDYNKDYPFAAFITNLGKYNEGALVGEYTLSHIIVILCVVSFTLL